MTISTRAAVAFDDNRPLVVTQLDLEAPGPGEVLIQLKAAGLCHTDLQFIDGSRDYQNYPIVLGHEGAGVVVECGTGVTSVAAGDHVIPLSIPECGQCQNCLSGKTNICQRFLDRPGGTVEFSLEGKNVAAFSGLGTFSEYTVVQEYALAKVSKEAPLDIVCCVGCAVATGIGAALFTAKINEGCSVAVFGIGGIGVNVLQGAKLGGAKQIIAIDTNPGKEAIARTFGATDFINAADAGEELLDIIRASSGGGVDYSFECVGHPSLINTAIESTHIGWGETVLIGIPSGGKLLTVDPYTLFNGRKVMGSWAGNTKLRSQLPMIVDWYLDGKIQLDALVSHRLSLNNINKGFELMKRGDGLRSVVIF